MTRPAARAAIGLLLSFAVASAACGGSPAARAKSTPKTLQEALGLDERKLAAREAKVQEAVAACMKAEGFDYIPVDPSQSGMRISIGGPGAEQSTDPTFRKTKGYGITTGAAMAPTSDAGASTDPNKSIRDALNEDSKKAYDNALFGSSTKGTGGAEGGGPVFVQREDGSGTASSAGGAAPADGCFGRAQSSVPGSADPGKLGPKLQQLEERIQADPRLVRANAKWAACMAAAGFDQYEKPEEIAKHLFNEMAKLYGAPDGSNGGPNGAITISGGAGAHVDEAKLAVLQREEIALANADYECARKSGRATIAKQVRTEAESRFLADNPDLKA